MSPTQQRLIAVWHGLLGAVIALLSVRLIVQLFAGRPDNLLISLLLQVTAPLTAPLAMLDAGQPRFGAILEISTLVLIGLLTALLLLPAAVAAAGRSLPSAGSQDD
jgi:hypothetical protein